MISRPENRYPRSSSFYSLANCEGAFQLSQKSGEEPPTPFSDRGTAIHSWLPAEKDQKPEIEPDALDTARDLEAKERAILISWAGTNNMISAKRETRLWLRDGLMPVYSGKPDLWIHTESREKVLLLDYKTGWHPLDHYVATNCQLRSYVPLIDEELDGQVQEVTAAILKPGKRLAPAVFDREEIDQARVWSINVALRAVQIENPTFTRGEWCKYCSGKLLCPAWKDEIQQLSDLVTSRMGDMPDWVLNEMAPRLEVAAMVIERLLQRLYYRVKEKPENFPDWRFEPGDIRRSVEKENNELIFDRLFKGGSISQTEFFECCNLSIAALEKVVRKNRQMKVRDTHVYIDRTIGDLVEHKPNKDKLVYDPKPKPSNETSPTTQLPAQEEKQLPDGSESQAADKGEENE